MKYPYAYFLLFHLRLWEDQEMSIRSKSLGDTILDTRTWKIFVFSLRILLITLRICILLSFSHFWVTWLENWVRKNLPIDFEFRILVLEWLYGLLYIKRKHAICGTQNYALELNSMTMVKFTVNFRVKWSKWPFCKKMIRNGHVTHHSRARKLFILNKIILTKNIGRRGC